MGPSQWVLWVDIIITYANPPSITTSVAKGISGGTCAEFAADEGGLAKTVDNDTVLGGQQVNPTPSVTTTSVGRQKVSYDTT